VAAASDLSKGGMLTKVLAAKRAARSGATTVIDSTAATERVLTRLCAGEALGTELRRPKP
jgi:glutamate 5-kinase